MQHRSTEAVFLQYAVTTRPSPEIRLPVCDNPPYYRPVQGTKQPINYVIMQQASPSIS